MQIPRRCLLCLIVPLFFCVLITVRAGGQVSAPGPAHAPVTTQSQATLSSARQAYALPPEKLAKAIALSRIRDILAIVGSLWGLAVLWLLLATRAAARVEAWTASVSRRRSVQGLIFFALFLMATELADLPLAWFAEHVSHRFGISVQSWPSWLGDLSKGLGLSLAIGVPVLLLFNWVVRQWPRRYWLGAWIVAVPLMAMGTFASPLLEPIFDTFEPLARSDPALAVQLEKVVARTGTEIPPERMYLMKASPKTNGLNAYVSGLGASKRVVVWDTTADRLPNDEILFIFAHESGHYVLHHIAKMLGVGAVFLFFLFWACARFAEWMAGRFGARWGVDGLAGRAGFVVLLFSVSVAGFVLEPAGNMLSRSIEHEADVYGQEAIHGIVPDPQETAVAAFNALGEAWLEDPNPNPVIEFWLYSHPSTQRRANFAKHYDPWAHGGRGEFFAK